MTFVERVRRSLHRLVRPTRLLRRDERHSLMSEAETQLLQIEVRMKALGLSTTGQHAETLARIDRLRRNLRGIDP